MNSNKLKESRIERGISISELARRADLHRITVSNIENGYSDPSISTVSAICKVLEKSPSEIFFETFVNHE